MASGVNRTQHTGNCNGLKADQYISTQDYDQELHMKMCKKIAQLTKVVYALNTKNDEHEAALQAIKDAHHEEIQHIIEETRGKLLEYKNRAGEETDLRQHIQNLEEALEQQKKLKENALLDFAMYKKQVEERQLKIENEHAERIMALSKEMLTMKKDFENKLCHFTELQQTLELNKQAAMLELEKKKQESDELQKQCIMRKRESMDERVKLEEQCKAEMQALMEVIEALRSENLKIIEDYEQKSKKMKTSFDKEKESLKKAIQQSMTETLKQWQEREAGIRKSMQAQETALQQKVKKLEADAESKLQKINEFKKHCQKLQSRIKDLEIQLEEAWRDSSDCKLNLQKLEDELTVSKERLILQENEILRKTEAMKTLVTSNNEAVGEVDELKSHLLKLQKESVDTLQSEKHELQQRHEEELKKVKRQCEEEKTRLKEQLVKGLEELVKKHSAEIKSLQSSMEVERKKLQMEHHVQFEEFKKKTENEIRQMEKEKEILEKRCQESLLEISRLENIAHQNETSTEKAALFECNSGETQGKLQQNLEKTHRKISELQDQLLQQKEKFQKELSEMKNEHERLRGHPSGEVDLKCKENLRPEDEWQHEPLKRQHPDKQKPGVTQLQKERNAENKSSQEELQQRTVDLQAQITQLKKKSELHSWKSQDTLQEPEVQFSKEKDKLRQELQDSIRQNQILKAQLEASQQRLLKSRDKTVQHNNKEIEERLKKEFSDNVRSQEQAHKLELQALEERARKDLQAERERAEMQQKLLLESMKLELSQQHTSWISQVNQHHKKQIEELQTEVNSLREMKKNQVERILVIVLILSSDHIYCYEKINICFYLVCIGEKKSQTDLNWGGCQANLTQDIQNGLDFKQMAFPVLGQYYDVIKEENNHIHLKGMKEEVDKQQNEINSLRKENTLLQNTVHLLSAESELKKQESVQLRDRESKQRPIEDDLKAKHKKELDSMKQDHRKEMQTIVSDFPSSQAHLQAKIVSLENKLKECDEKHRKRDSKPEDLQLIGKLQDKLSERDQLIKRLMEERRFSNTVTVNNGGQTNCSCNPAPGSLTPTMKKKKTEEPPSRVVSVPNLVSYEKSFSSRDSSPVRRMAQLIKSASVDHSFSQKKEVQPRVPVQNTVNETNPRSSGKEKTNYKGSPEQENQCQEWFTRYFSF
ncbi:protein FAM184B [Protopterus annectens]|uniref:protein FAM184B n=1 Tax=Protopterus annectens TaxID=7888 RepID=UPI001CFBFC82|nr:protein FAM184B [Protopterus annectens]